MTEDNEAHAATHSQPSSSFATGGGGTVFELNVQTGLLAMLLVRGHAPAFDDALIHELHLQAGHRGYSTDDALVIAIDGSGHHRRQLWAMKHGIRFAESDRDFQQVIEDAWADFLDTERFDADLDAFVLATGSIALTYRSLLTVLEVARAALTAEDFYARTSLVGYLAQRCRDYVALLQRLCASAAGREVEPDLLWRFLRCLHILSYDFGQSASQDEARFKTLLSLAVRSEAELTGDDLWNRIFSWVAEGNSRASSFTRESLPCEWRLAAPSVAGHFGAGAIRRLLEHSDDLVKRIRTCLGPGVHLPRRDLTIQLGAAFVSEQFTLVTGQAGVGKSAAALVALREVRGGAPLFVFQAAEFARVSLEHALSDLRVTEPLSRTSALFALHRRKYLLIESVDRLLESPERDAFFTLLQRLGDDPTWRVVLTCRQYASAMVRDAFLTPLNLSAVEHTVLVLDDTELDCVIQRVPGLGRIASHPRTRELLRNPWYLDRACAVDWSSESGSEVDQRRLRSILWQRVVMRDSQRTDGMHFRRGRCFCDIALRRARSLQSFVPCEQGEEDVIQALVADDLLVEEPSTQRVSPAHDVLEDWALMQWVTQLHATLSHDPGSFFEALGEELPIRRSYRQWLHESLSVDDLTSTLGFVDDVLSACAISSYWKDETLVSILSCREASRFIREHEESLLADDKLQLRRLIHLLRIACRKPNPLSSDLSEELQAMMFGDLYLIPDGPAWGASIRLVHHHLDKFGIDDLPLVLGLLEDFKTGISLQELTPAGAREAGLIALHFWHTLEDHYSSRHLFERLASILLAVPHAIPDEYSSLLCEAISAHTRSQRLETLQEKLLASLECWASCRSHPKTVAALAKMSWGMDRPLPDRSQIDANGIDIDEFFGLADNGHRYFPASALQGPFWALLRSHPDTGLALILELSNVAAERYARLQLLDSGSANPTALAVDLGGGCEIRQWASLRLWLMYRGGMPGPYVLQSALMALEKWLLDLAQAGEDLRDLTRALIAGSNNVSVTAVVAAVAMAHPHSVGDTALALVRIPALFEYDSSRLASDRSPISGAFSGWARGSDRVHDKERVESDKLPHRSRCLELLACDLQLGPLREEVWSLIDQLKNQLPPSAEQSEEHKLWRLRLHRIDLRNYVPDEQTDEGYGAIALRPSSPDPDIIELLAESYPVAKASAETMGMMAWGNATFERRDPEKFDAGLWREMLSKAQHLLQESPVEDAGEVLSYNDACGYVLAVCVRDHWDELTPAERQLSRDFLLDAVMEEKDNLSRYVSVQRFRMLRSRAAAQVLPLLLNRANESEQLRVREAIAAAVTHAIAEVRELAAAAVGLHLWSIDADLASACIAGLLCLARLERRVSEQLRGQPVGSQGVLADLVWREIEDVRARILSREPLSQTLTDSIDIQGDFCRRLLPLIASMVMHRCQDPAAQSIMRRIAESLAKTWSTGRQRYRQRDYETEADLTRLFALFVVGCDAPAATDLWRPFVDAVPRCAREVADAFGEMIWAEDMAGKGEAFWAIWRQIRDCILDSANYNRLLRSDHSDLSRLASALLLDGVPWKDGVKDWSSLHGHESELRSFIEAAGSAPPVCKSFVRLLGTVGSRLLPGALVWLDESLTHGDTSAMIGDRDTLFLLARILTPLVFGQTSALRDSPKTRGSALRILNAMVDLGSSAAFRMRDFLVTPTTPVVRSGPGHV